MSKFRVVVLLAVVALLLFPAMALAQEPPERPCRFYGTVTVNGAQVADDTLITAMIGGVAVGNATTPYLAGPSTYSVLIEQPEGADYDGATVTFQIGGLTATQTGTWEAGKNEELNLSVGEAPVVTGGAITDVVITTLAAGESATADYDATTGVLTLGIPAGAKGDKGDQGIQGLQGDPGEDAPGGIALPIVALVIAVIAAGVAMMSMRRRV